MSRTFSIVINSKEVRIEVETSWENDDTYISNILAYIVNDHTFSDDIDISYSADGFNMPESEHDHLPSEWDVVCALNGGGSINMRSVIDTLLGPEHLKCIDIYLSAKEIIEAWHQVKRAEQLIESLEDPGHQKTTRTNVEYMLAEATKTWNKALEDPVKYKPHHVPTVRIWLRDLQKRMDDCAYRLEHLSEEMTEKHTTAMNSLNQRKTDWEQLRHRFCQICIETAAWNPSLLLGAMHDFSQDNGYHSFLEHPLTFLDWYQEVPSLRWDLSQFLDVELLDRLAQGWEAEKEAYRKRGYLVPMKELNKETTSG